MGIAFGSINTGLPKDIVEQIMKAERIPVQKMEGRKEKIQEKTKLVNELTELVRKMKEEVDKNTTARSLREFKVMTNEEIIDVTVDKNIAEPGTYQFEVNNLAQKSSAFSSGFEDPDESYVGVGFIQYFLPDGDVKDIYVDSDNANLRGVAKLINKDKTNGMHALVINDGSQSDTPWRLLIALDDTGDEKLAEFPYFYFVDGEQDLYLEFEREAHDALVKLDGFEIELAENKASEMIPGVTIDLKKAKPGEEFTIQIIEDVQAIGDKLDAIVKNINDVLQFIITQNALDENSDTQRTLGGDVTLQTIESRLRATIFKTTKTELGDLRIGDLGITFQRSGLLSFDKGVFESRLSGNFKSVLQALTGFVDEDGNKHMGFIQNLANLSTGLTRFPNGMLPTRKNGIQAKIEQIDRQIEQRERLLEQKEKNLKDKFARLEGTIARIKNQGAGLAALGGGGTNPVTQLAGKTVT